MSKNQIDLKNIEDKWKKFWEKERIHKANLKSKKIYAVDTPPPTVSGKMHIGHAFSYAQQDFIVRFRRMFDGNVFYPFGTDDNGLPTERLVEKLKKAKSKDMSRSKFIDLCLKTIKEIIPEFIQDWKDLGMSCDFEVLYSTIDNSSRKISQKSFIDLYKKGEVYQKKFPTLWCPECQTSIAQAELEDKEEDSLFSTLKFSSEGKDLLIATTRPELLEACVAVFVNPKDKRYKNLVGKKARAPLFNHEIPILKDYTADMEKGTGVLMICSYGDKFDVDAIVRHKLKPNVILNEKGELINGKYKGLKIKEARKKILEDLKKFELIKEQKEISHIVNVHDKCGTPIEFLATEQWFIRLLDKKKKLIEQGEKIKWYPIYMFKRYENWVKGLEWDWSISRDRHFGVPIPIWKCKCGKIILPKDNELPIYPLQTKKKCPKCKKNAVPEKKVLDTWATSSLSPQIAEGLVNNQVKLPFSLRPQAHDIIRTWAFYTIVQSYLHKNKIPWKDIVISGNVTLKGEKMSKSKGNVVSPQDVIKEYGADALRFWAAGSKLGSDLDYHEKDVKTGKRFVVKLINASRFVFMNLKGYKGQKPKKLEKLDEVFLDRLQIIINSATTNFKKYEYSKVKGEVEEFFWKDFCDNYLEIVKKRVYDGKGEKKLSAQYTLYKSLLTILKLIAPIMPYITEEIYQENFRKIEKDKSIHISAWPTYKRNPKFANDFIYFKDLLSVVRQEKSKNQKPMNAEINLTLDKKNIKGLGEMKEDFQNVTKAKEIKTGKFKVEFTK